MIKYLLRRALYAIPILFGINVLTFVLFFMVNSPDDIARMHLGNKYVSQQEVDDWKVAHGYNLPLFINNQQQGIAKIKDTLFFKNHYYCLLLILVYRMLDVILAMTLVTECGLV